jgi:hypothetical protein
MQAGGKKIFTDVVNKYKRPAGRSQPGDLIPWVAVILEE